MYPAGLADFIGGQLACGVDGPLGYHCLRGGFSVDPCNEKFFSRRII